MLKIEGNKVFLSLSLLRCKTCGELMTPWYSPLALYTFNDLKKQGVKVVKESYRDSGICTDCIINGGFPRGCECCHKYREFPKEFKYQLTKYAKYPEDETEFQYICYECAKDNPHKVIDTILEYDDIEEIKHEFKTSSN